VLSARSSAVTLEAQLEPDEDTPADSE